MNHSVITANLPPDLKAIELVERDAWLDFYAAAPATYAASMSIQSKQFDGYAVLAHKGIPMPEFNRAIGLGIDHPMTASALDKAIGWLDANADPAWAIQLPPSERTAEIELALEKRGLKPRGNGWAKFEYTPVAASTPPSRSNLNVRQVEASAAGHFGSVIADSFGFPQSSAPWFSALVGRPKWQCYLVYDGSSLAAGAALYLDGGWAWMGMDTTLAAYRDRGAQAALINRRVIDGIRQGVKCFTAETGQPSPNGTQANHSHNNYARANFRKAYVRPNYRRT